MAKKKEVEEEKEEEEEEEEDLSFSDLDNQLKAFDLSPDHFDLVEITMAPFQEFCSTYFR